MNCGICVDLPEPVSPHTIVTTKFSMFSMISRSCIMIGRSVLVVDFSAAFSVTFVALF